MLAPSMSPSVTECRAHWVSTLNMTPRFSVSQHTHTFPTGTVHSSGAMGELPGRPALAARPVVSWRWWGQWRGTNSALPVHSGPYNIRNRIQNSSGMCTVQHDSLKPKHVFKVHSTVTMQHSTHTFSTGTPWMHSAESAVPSLGTATSSVTSLPLYQQEVPLRTSTARLDSAHVLETLRGEYFTSECKLKMILLKATGNATWLSSLDVRYISGAVFTPTWRGISAFISLDSEWTQTMRAEASLSYRIYINCSAKCFVTDSARYSTLTYRNFFSNSSFLTFGIHITFTR
jgi:hypothetical protein